MPARFEELLLSIPASGGVKLLALLTNLLFYDITYTSNMKRHSTYPSWVLKFKKPGTAIHKIRNHFYLYEIKSRWDLKLKRARKITSAYLGVITPQGVLQPRKQAYMPSSVKEYGTSSWLLTYNKDIIEALQRFFPYWWRELVALSFMRLLYQCPLKNMAIHWPDLWLSDELAKTRLSPEVLKELLEEIGSNREAVVEFLRSFIHQKEALLIDLTHIFSASSGVRLASVGYNSQRDFQPQVNLLYLYSLNRRIPLFYRLLPGNVRDVSSLKATVEESGLKEVILIADKGFFSDENVRLLRHEGLHFILPLKRNHHLIDYSLLKGTKQKMEGHFKFHGRFIWHYSLKTLYGTLFVFLDERLRVSEEEDYLNRIGTHPDDGYSLEEFHEKSISFGTISLLTDLEMEASKVYQYFKSRAYIETLIDCFKNILEADRSYMRTDKALEGWVFINHLALWYYYRLYNSLLKANLLRDYSVLDVLLILSKIRKVRVQDRWVLLEMPKPSRLISERLAVPIT